MKPQDIQNLQEAYSQVYDESYKDLGDKARDKGHQLLNKSKKTATRGSIYSGVKPSNTPEGEKLQNRASNQFAVSAVHNPEKAQAKSAANKEKGEKKKKAFGNRLMRSDKQGIRDNYEYDLYDIILSHLLDEGYAETQEQAQVIMVNMSEGWRESIVEAMKPLPVGKMIKQAAYKAYYASKDDGDEKVDKQVAKMSKVADTHNPNKSKRKEDDNRREGGRKRDAGRPRSNELQDNW